MSSPVSTFFGLQTTLRGLLAQQRAVDVTSHNVANANTEGYSRQEAVFEPTAAFDIRTGALTGRGGGRLVSGVDVTTYRRIRDGFLDLQYRAQNMSLGEWQGAPRHPRRGEGGPARPARRGAPRPGRGRPERARRRRHQRAARQALERLGRRGEHTR